MAFYVLFVPFFRYAGIVRISSEGIISDGNVPPPLGLRFVNHCKGISFFRNNVIFRAQTIPTVTFVTVMEVFTNLVVALCVAYNCLKIIDVVDVVHLIALIALHVGKGAAESVLCRVCRLIKFPKALVVKASFQKTW